MGNSDFPEFREGGEGRESKESRLNAKWGGKGKKGGRRKEKEEKEESEKSAFPCSRLRMPSPPPPSPKGIVGWGDDITGLPHLENISHEDSSWSKFCWDCDCNIYFIGQNLFLCTFWGMDVGYPDVSVSVLTQNELLRPPHNYLQRSLPSFPHSLSYQPPILRQKRKRETDTNNKQEDDKKTFPPFPRCRRCQRRRESQSWRIAASTKNLFFPHGEIIFLPKLYAVHNIKGQAILL